MQKDILKKEITKNYSKIALEESNPNSCCIPHEFKNNFDSNINLNPKQTLSNAIGYRDEDLQFIPKESNLGLGCGAPLNYGDIKEGETLVDLGSGAGIDVFLASKKVTDTGKVIGIDMTDEMLEKARNVAIKNNYNNLEFRKGDIEEKIPVEDNSIDIVISNCVINLTSNKTNTFKEVYRILKKEGKGRTIISDLITNKEVNEQNTINVDKWCSCIDGALTKENYLQSIKDAGFQNIQVLNEKTYLDENQFSDGRKIVSMIIRAITN